MVEQYKTGATALATSEQKQASGKVAFGRDRRAYERYEINAPGGCLNYKGSKFPSTIVNVSLGGCCVRTEIPFLGGNLANVEVELPIHGMVLRLVGIIQWIKGKNVMGIRFILPSARSKNQLAGLLTCLVDSSATEEIKAALVEASTETATTQSILPVKVLEAPKVAAQKPKSPVVPPPEDPALPEPAAQKTSGEAFNPEVDEWPAVLRFLHDSSHLAGAIVGLTLEGCCFLTADRKDVATQIRVEVEFQMRGLPFRLAGVVETVHNWRNIDIRFAALSSRRREELSQVLEELREPAKAPPPASEGEDS